VDLIAAEILSGLKTCQILMFRKMGVNDITLEKLPQEGRIYNKK
jgi:hypothetical protein